MNITIAPEQSIAAIQAVFQAEFPYLKLAFFTKPHAAFKGSAAKFLISDQQKKLEELNPELKGKGAIELLPVMPTWQVERLFETSFGLHVQVFRKSGNTWLETSVSDALTLEQQNAKGKGDEYIHQEFVDPIDYREQP